MINSGGVAALLNVIQRGESDVIFPAVLAIGYLAGQSDFMALAVKAAKVNETIAILYSFIILFIKGVLCHHCIFKI